MSAVRIARVPVACPTGESRAVPDGTRGQPQTPPDLWCSGQRGMTIQLQADGPTWCQPRARTGREPATSSDSQTMSKPGLIRQAAAGPTRKRPPKRRSRVRVAFRTQVIYQPRRPTDEPPGKGGAFAPIRRDDEHQGDEHLENGPPGGPRPRAPGRLRSPRFFTPSPSYADAARSSLHQRGENPAPPGNQSVNEMRRARLRRERCRAP